jgi:polyhydroxybutyrate depolymerase
MLARALVSAILWMMPLAAAALPMQATIPIAGSSRDYVIDIPPGAGPKPAILLLHGLGGSGDAIMHATRLALLGEEDGFVSIFPDAIAHRWNFFPPGAAPASYLPLWQQAGASAAPDDVGFLRGLVGELVARGVVDPKRVYIAGFSAGGFMSMRMICEDPELFAGVALFSSSMPDPVGALCQPRLPTPFYAIKGANDQNEPYNGGPVLDGTFSVWSAARLTEFFRHLDGCSGAGAPIFVQGENPARESFIRWACTGGPVILGTVQGGPHMLYPIPPPAPTLWWFFSPLHR